MALFKIVRGSEEDLPVTKTDGYAYFCTDTWNFFIDYKDNNNFLHRAKLNANLADGLHYLNNGSVVEIDASAIALRSEVTVKLNTAQGAANYGKVMAVGIDGDVTPVALHQLGGGLTWGSLVGGS